MPHVEATVAINRDADSLWKEIGSFQGVGEWHPMLAAVEGQGEEPGSTRTAVTQDGQRQVERLQQIVPVQHRYRYQMVSTPMPVSDYVGEFVIHGDDAGQSTLVWTADFDVISSDQIQVTGMVREFLTAGVDSVQKRYG
jgi:polyketide cyclase/dehydrase/lipid transport protein